MSEFTNYLKISTTALVLTMIENGITFQEFSVENPIKALNEINSKNINAKIKRLKRISKKAYFGNFITLPDTNSCSPLDVQKIYLEKALDFIINNKSLAPEWTEECTNSWNFVLNSLEKNPKELNRHIDWVIKKFLITEYIKSKRKKLNDEEVQKINLCYHLLSNETGFAAYDTLLDLEKIVTKDEIEKAIHSPPNNTRAYGRTKILEDLVKQKTKDIAFTWDSIRHGRNIIPLPEPDSVYSPIV